MATLLDRALYLLSQRDRSEAELRRKLQMPTTAQRRALRKPEAVEPSVSADEIEAAVQYCLDNDWINDTRYAGRYISSRSKRGYGEQKIRMELMQKGIDRDIVDAAFSESDIDRAVQAREVAWKKFGQPLPSDREVKIKVQRYLLSRGFSFDEIRSIYINF